MHHYHHYHQCYYPTICKTMNCKGPPTTSATTPNTTAATTPATQYNKEEKEIE